MYELQDGALSLDDLFLGLFDEHVEISERLDVKDRVESRWHETLFSLKENNLAVLFVVTISKGGRAGPIYNLAGPQLVATHTVWVRTDAQQEPLNTASTRTKIAKRTLDLFAI